MACLTIMETVMLSVYLALKFCPCSIALFISSRMPDDPTYVEDLEELFGRKLDDVRILTPFICDFGNRVKFGKGVFINHSAILSASGGIEFEDGSMAAPGLRIATINHDMNERHAIYTYGKVTVKKNAWIGMNVTICPGVTIGTFLFWGLLKNGQWNIIYINRCSQWSMKGADYEYYRD